jgi:2,3-bisphosphoglycerate-independent phosphoglycerate mutase
VPAGAGPLPILLVVLDGMADRPYAELDGRTPLEAASTPSMDALAREGQSGFCYPLGPGRVPSTELVHFRFFGYEGHHFPGRACLEAIGANVPCEPGDAFAFLALRGVVRGPEGDYRVAGGYGEAFGDARRGYDALDGWEDGPSGYRFEVFPLAPYERGEAILRVRRGGAKKPPCGEITDSDPFFFTALPVLRPRPLRSANRPRSATLTAEALNRFLSAAADEMAGKKHSTGTGTSGFRRLVVSKWAGAYEPLIPFEERAGLPGAVVASGRMMRGLAHALGLRFVAAGAPGGSTEAILEDPAGDLREKLDEALGLLSSGEAGFAHVHSKAADEAAHAGEARRKVEVIEELDRALSPLRRTPLEDLVLCVTSDHCTPVDGRTVHWGDSVPVLVRGPRARVDDVESFGERTATRGTLGQIGSEDLLPYLLCQAEAAHFLGARPQPSPPLGVPVSGEPWVYEEPDGSAAGRPWHPTRRGAKRRPEGHGR